MSANFLINNTIPRISCMYYLGLLDTKSIEDNNLKRKVSRETDKYFGNSVQKKKCHMKSNSLCKVVEEFILTCSIGVWNFAS